MDNKEYNGYKNWATWNVCLWFNNDRLLYEMSKTARNATNLKAIFWSEIDLFKDFAGKEEEAYKSIDWEEAFNNTGGRAI